MASKKHKIDSTYKKKIIISACLICALAAGAVVSGFALKSYKKNMADKEFEEMLNIDNIYNNVYVDTISLGGLTKEQAKEKLEVELQQKRFGERKLTLKCPNSRFSIDMPYEAAGMKYDIDTAVEEAYAYGRTGTIEEKREIQEDLDAVGKFITVQYTFDEDMVKQFVEDIAPEVEASVKEFTGGIEVKVDVDTTVGMITQLLNMNEYDGVVNIAVVEQ